VGFRGLKIGKALRFLCHARAYPLRTLKKVFKPSPVMDCASFIYVHMLCLTCIFILSFAHIMPFIVGGVPASVAYSSNAFPSRMSRSFSRRLTIPYHTARSQNLCASVTVTLPTGAFTCVLDFCLTCELPPIDVVLGLDRMNACGNANITIFPLSDDIGKLSLT